MPVYLSGLATAVPQYILPQPTVEETARQVLGKKYSQFERLAKTFQTSGVEKRYSLAPLKWFHDPKNWPQRNSVYLQGSKKLFCDVASAALKDANWNADEVDTIITVSSTGIATPTLEALAWKEMGFRTDIRRIPVFGLGCAGGVSGLSIAQTCAEANPGTKILMVALEACSVSFRSDRMQKADIIATVLFGDGAAAACLSSDRAIGSGPIAAFGQGQEELWPDTLDIMGWDVDETGLGVIFDRSIPQFALDNLAEAADKAIARAGLKRADITRFICHPGGAKVVEAIESAMDLNPNSLVAERTVLRDFGNMSAPTVLFVLKRVLDSGLSGQMMMSALGPGFTASFMPITVEPQNA